MRQRTTPYLARSALARARRLRRDMTDAERVLWRGLRARLSSARFRHQVPFGRYCADFASHRYRLIVEVDGSQHQLAAEYDLRRTRFLRVLGYRVLRFWNNAVLGDLDAVIAAIAAQLPSPHAGEGGAKRRMGGARRSRAPAAGRHPHPSPPHKGEGGKDNLQLESI